MFINNFDTILACDHFKARLSHQPPRATAVVRYAEGDVGVGDHRPAPGVLQVDAPCEVPSGAEVGSPDDGPHVIRQTGEGCWKIRNLMLINQILVYINMQHALNTSVLHNCRCGLC